MLEVAAIVLMNDQIMLEVTEIVTLDTQIVLEVAEIVMMGGCPDHACSHQNC
jgi:hypothetical protein